VKSRWLLGDLDHLLLRLSRNRAALDLSPDSPSGWRTLVDFLTCAGPRVHYDVISAADWRPFVYELQQYGRGLIAGAPRRTRRSLAEALAVGRVALEP